MSPKKTITRRATLSAIALAALTGLALSACSSSAATGTSTGGATGAASGGKLLGIVSLTATDAKNAQVIQGATDAAKAAGWTVEVVDAQGSADQANAAIRNFVSKGAGAIFDLVVPTTSLGAGLNAAKQANIPVATWAGGLGTAVVMTTGDGGPFAEPSTKALLDAMGDSGSVLALTYHTGQACRDREAVFDKAVAAHPGIKVTKNEVNIPGFLQDGAKYATAWLASHPAGSGNLAVWGCWEDPTLGAISAIQQQNRTDVKTYGINGSQTAIKAVQDGTLTATVYEDGKAEGKTMFDVTQQAIAAGSSWQPKDVDVPGILVTKETVADFITQHPEAMK